MTKLGERLDKIRKSMNFTLQQFGEELDYGDNKSPARQIMSRMVNNHRLPSYENLTKLHKLGVDLNWLITGIGEIYKKGDKDLVPEMTYHFYDGPNYVETVISKELVYPEIINMQSNEIFSIKIDTEMMFPSIKIGDTVNAVKVERVNKDGLYVCINKVDGFDQLWIKRLFLCEDGNTFDGVTDNPVYPNYKIPKDLIDNNHLNLRVFSIMLTVDKV
jgi:hypothetical protein